MTDTREFVTDASVGRRWWILRGPEGAVSLTALPLWDMPVQSSFVDEHGVRFMPDCFTVHRPGTEDPDCPALTQGCDARGGALSGAHGVLRAWIEAGHDDTVIRPHLESLYTREFKAQVSA